MKKFFLLASFAVLTVLACDDQRLQTDIDDENIRNYLKANNLTAEKHTSGIYYTIETPGTGNNPITTSIVKVKFKRYLTDGTVFDQTLENEPVQIALQSDIPGWQVAVPLLKSGGKGKFFLPSGWAYGRTDRTDGAGNIVIPGNSIVILDIELISFR